MFDYRGDVFHLTFHAHELSKGPYELIPVMRDFGGQRQ